MPRRTVAYVFPTSHRFRVAFHEQVRKILDAHGVDYKYYYSDVDNRGKGDTEAIRWASRVPVFQLRLGKRRIFFQHAFAATRDADLVVLQQENSLLSNYPIQIARRITGRRVAFFGHGRNFQADRLGGAAEKFKRFWLTKVDWWFAYTERSARIVSDAGYPRDRITVFNNAIDTSGILAEIRALDSERQHRMRQEMFAGSRNVGAYVGGLYPEKRVTFLLAAARIVREKVPDFHLLIIGAGEDAKMARAAAQELPWVHYLGPKFGMEKTQLMSLAKILMMPGLVGLAVLDAFAYGTPIVTTAVPYHSPEIDYLIDGDNGIVVENSQSAEAYAGAVVRLLTDEPFRLHLQAGGYTAARTYTIEAMAERFSLGVLSALDRPPKNG